MKKNKQIYLYLILNLNIFFVIILSFLVYQQLQYSDYSWVFIAIGFIFWATNFLFLNKINVTDKSNVKQLLNKQRLTESQISDISTTLSIYKKSEQQLLSAEKSDHLLAPLKSRLLTDLNHQLRTPLNGILGMMSLLKATKLNREQKEYLDVAEDSANDLLSIFKDILLCSNTNYFSDDKNQEKKFDYKFPADTKLLLIEDNPVNQKVATKFLKKLNLTADIANNGKEGLELIQENTYDIILMDCDMPILNGYQTTKAIRKLENSKQHVHIIAMTAHTLKQDREKCFTSGMDDFISKPIQLELLANRLDKWLSQPKEHLEPSPNSKKIAQKKAVSLFDKTIVQGIQNIVGKEAFNDMLQSFIEDVPKLLNIMSTDDKSKQLKAAAELRTSSKTIGAIVLSRLARDIEISIQKQQPISQLLAQTSSVFEQVKILT